MKRQDLIDYMLFSTHYETLAECFQDNNKLKSLWEYVIKDMCDNINTELLNDLPRTEEMKQSKYVEAYNKAIKINQ